MVFLLQKETSLDVIAIRSYVEVKNNTSANPLYSKPIRLVSNTTSFLVSDLQSYNNRDFPPWDKYG